MYILSQRVAGSFEYDDGEDGDGEDGDGEDGDGEDGDGEDGDGEDGYVSCPPEGLCVS